MITIHLHDSSLNVAEEALNNFNAAISLPEIILCFLEQNTGALFSLRSCIIGHEAAAMLSSWIHSEGFWHLNEVEVIVD